MTRRTRPVIITGDDFGRTTRINQAIAHAHANGILGSASLMVTGEAVDEAVECCCSSVALGASYAAV